MSDYHEQQLNKHMYQSDEESAREQAIEDLSSELSTDITAAIYSVSKFSNYINVSDVEIMNVLDSEAGVNFLTAVSEMILKKGGEL